MKEKWLVHFSRARSRTFFMPYNIYEYDMIRELKQQNIKEAAKPAKNTVI